jgi:hypothetical protein
MTINIAQQMLDKYIAAEMAVLTGKEFQLNGRRVTREDLDKIRDGRKEWQRTVNNENSRAAGNNTLGSSADFSTTTF